MSVSIHIQRRIPAASPRGKRGQQGVVLLESLIAILIFSMGILALVGLQAAMITNTTDAKYRAEANYIAQQRLGKIWTDTDNLSNYVKVDDISELLPNGTRTVTLPGGGGQVRVVVTWRLPDSPEEHNVTLNASIIPGV